MTRNARVAMAILTLFCIAQVKLVEDPPLSRPPKAGDLTGTISPAEKVAELSAAVRATGKTYKADSFNKITGKFAFRDLPGDTVYDLRIKLDDGTRVEGVDLGFVDERMGRLAELRRRQLGLPGQEAGQERSQFGAEDADAVIKYALELRDNDFLDHCRVLYVAGHGKRATMLVERMRTREFHEAKGDLVWRVELWYFENRYGGWERVSKQERVLERVRANPQEWRKLAVYYLPQLSMRLDEKGKCPPLEFRIPDKFDPATGRPRNSEPTLQTKPVVVGLDSQKPADDLQSPAEKPAK